MRPLILGLLEALLEFLLEETLGQGKDRCGGGVLRQVACATCDIQMGVFQRLVRLLAVLQKVNRLSFFFEMQLGLEEQALDGLVLEGWSSWMMQDWIEDWTMRPTTVFMEILIFQGGSLG